MFSVAYRDQVRDFVLQLARSDRRILAGAVVGSLALSEGDRWSDLDLTFAVADVTPLAEVLEAWTRRLTDKFGAIQLFDLPSGPSFYRVFFLPGCLQFDLSFTPASKFGATGPKFKLLFGSSVEKPYTQSPPGSGTIWLCRPSCFAGPFLRRAGSLLAGRILDQQPAGLCPQPGVPQPRSACLPWPGL